MKNWSEKNTNHLSLVGCYYSMEKKNPVSRTFFNLHYFLFFIYLQIFSFICKLVILKYCLKLIWESNEYARTGKFMSGNFSSKSRWMILELLSEFGIQIRAFLESVATCTHKTNQSASWLRFTALRSNFHSVEGQRGRNTAVLGRKRIFGASYVFLLVKQAVFQCQAVVMGMRGKFSCAMYSWARNGPGQKKLYIRSGRSSLKSSRFTNARFFFLSRHLSEEIQSSFEKSHS